MLEIAITNEEKVKVTLTPVTRTGLPALLDGAPVWTVTSGSSTLEVDPDGLSAYLVSSDAAGDSTFKVEADADLGERVQLISDTITLHVEAATAANLGLAAGPAEPK